MKIRKDELKDFLEEKTELYNRKNFISSDPVSVPHKFSLKQDIEISGFFAATIAWGQRKAIIKNAEKLVKIMGDSPYDFVMSSGKKQLGPLQSFVHRTFNGKDAGQFVLALRKIYEKNDSLELVFLDGINNEERIISFHRVFTAYFSEKRTCKHVANPSKGSSAKRINMFLRWMVRKDKKGVDFGIWEKMKPAELFCPLDLHSGNVARKLGLLKRKQNDWKAVNELTTELRKMDPHDPVKYDFALFGLGVFEKF